MILVITKLRLKSFWKIFQMVRHANLIRQQHNEVNSTALKTYGFWLDHYTMSLWRSEEEMKTFAHSGAHLNAMKASSQIAKEIKTAQVERQDFVTWKVAKDIVTKKGRKLK
ncbi:MAG: DUF3291 domain-containing protein [Cyclobacteriaceae bacterium]